jgi:hypothetical protein
MLQDDDGDQDKGQDGPEDDEDPDVDLFVRDAQDACPIYQHTHTPVEDLIHCSPPVAVGLHRILQEVFFQKLAKPLIHREVDW